jgi:pilus assembly protein CpaF
MHSLGRSLLSSASIEDMPIAGAKAPTCPHGSFLTIRKHQDKGDRSTLARLIEMEALTAEQAEKLVDLVIQKCLTCIVADATGSGKTTLLKALLIRIPSNERLVTIEDSRKMQLEVTNVINLPLRAAPSPCRRHCRGAIRQGADRLYRQGMRAPSEDRGR